MHHRKERGKAVAVLEASSVSSARKHSFKFPHKSLGARNSHNISAYLSSEFLFPTIYTKIVYFSYPFTSATFLLQLPFYFKYFWAVSRCFTDTECWISLCLLTVKVYRSRQLLAISLSGTLQSPFQLNELSVPLMWGRKKTTVLALSWGRWQAEFFARDISPQTTFTFPSDCGQRPLRSAVSASVSRSQTILSFIFILSNVRGGRKGSGQFP